MLKEETLPFNLEANFFSLSLVLLLIRSKVALIMSCSWLVTATLTTHTQWPGVSATDLSSCYVKPRLYQAQRTNRAATPTSNICSDQTQPQEACTVSQEDSRPPLLSKYEPVVTTWERKRRALPGGDSGVGKIFAGGSTTVSHLETAQCKEKKRRKVI